MLQLNSKNIPYQSVQVFLSLVSKFSDIATPSSLALILALKALLSILLPRERFSLKPIQNVTALQKGELLL